MTRLTPTLAGKPADRHAPDTNSPFHFRLPFALTLAPPFVLAVSLAVSLAGTAASVEAAPPRAEDYQRLAEPYTREVRGILSQYCHECHSGDRLEADIDLAAFMTLADVRRQPGLWLRVAEMMESGQMPPRAARPVPDAQRTQLLAWVRAFLTLEAAARDGDPGPVVLRRLSNAEFTYTLRDLTGIPTLDPAREFPVDSAAGEGFTNVGQSLVMSPALLTKYLDAAKDVSAHVVLLPGGWRFSPATTRRDWTNECLARVRDFYARYSAEGGGSAVNLQGIQFDTNQGGRLPIERYLAALLAERASLTTGQRTVAAVAADRGLSPRYLETLWQTLQAAEDANTAAPLAALRARWQTAGPADLPALVAQIVAWQSVLWKFNSIGHIGREGGVQAWMEPVSPLVTRREFRQKLNPVATANEVVVRLRAEDADGREAHDFVVWERPRLVAPGRPDLLVRDVRRVTAELTARRDRHFAQAARCLQAVAEVTDAPAPADPAALAVKHGVDPDALLAWLDFLGVAAGGEVKLGTPLPRKMENAAGYNFIQGWVGDDALSVIANSSDQTVRIPGTMKPHSVAVHPSPTLAVAVGWRSAANGSVNLRAQVQHAHPECGNGVAWSLELRRGNTRQRLGAGVTQGATPIAVGPFDKVAVRAGDVVSLVINPRDGNHSCDLTAIDLTVNDGQQEWNLARDVSGNLLAGNPHADGAGQAGVWHFYSEPAASVAGHVLPAGSLLARWQATADPAVRGEVANQLQQLLTARGAGLAADSPDAALYRQLTSASGPFLAAALRALPVPSSSPVPAGASASGLDPALFGRHPDGRALEEASLGVRAPHTLEIRLPAELAAGAELVTTGYLHAGTGREGAVRLAVTIDAAADAPLPLSEPMVVVDGSQARARLEQTLETLRQLFPPAICYTKIVPVDEVVTLTLYYREDHLLRRLMRDEQQARELDQLWDELLYVAREPLETVTAFEQISEFATQDRPDLVKAFAPLRKPIRERAEAFRQRLVADEPAHWSRLRQFADEAYRRPLTSDEATQLRALYDSLRQQEIGHDEALRLTLARVLVSPAFLYRAETPGPGSTSLPVNDWELANRLSYFLWSSQPDQHLRELAAAGKLHDDATLVAETRRMLADPRARRLATEFACHWLHIYGFDQHNEKSERHFPTFAALRGAMYEESILFFLDLFQRPRSILELVDADYTYLNADLARHYGIPGVEGPQWRLVEGVRQYARGGILTQASTLSKQAGASRTSPILRGNWLSEVVLGEKLPRPPKNVPQLSDTVPEGLTERQLVERHSTEPACAKCHARIDPFGYALEEFDAIGRHRTTDAAGLKIDSQTALPDGTRIAGLRGLQDYVANARREAFVRQFLRKLLGYSLGRAVQLSDEPLLARLTEDLRRHDYRAAGAIEGIVLSRQFRDIRGRDQPTDEATAGH